MNFQNEIEKEANLWIMKENEGLIKEEKIELKQWLQNKNHQKVYYENKNLIDECLNLDNDFITELEEEFLAETKTNNVFYKGKYIAASLLIACIMIFGTFEIKNYFTPSFSHTYVTANEKKLNISLPDHSTIDLDAKSKLQIEYFSSKRIVDLKEGKALFSVAKNKKRPFIIKSGKTIIEVLGTTFEVINLDDTTTVNVTEGIVRVDYVYNSQNEKVKTIIQLRQSETLSLNNKGKILNHGKVNVKKIASWRNDLLEFNKTTLKEAINLFRRYTDTQVKFENYELSQLTISGKYSTKQYDSFLESIALIYPIKIIKNNNLIKIVNN